MPVTYKNTNFARLTPFAKKLRNDSTPGEIRLWCELLRNKQMMGKKFLRQRPIEKYIVDFMCRELMLVIEVDGYSHNFKAHQDAKRDKNLSDLGFTILRFAEKDVMKNLSRVSSIISATIEELEFKEKHPPA